MNCVQAFETIYKSAPHATSFCPYRVCPIGAHVDHQYGKITGLAIDKGITIAYRAKQNGVVELNSLNFEKRAQFHIHNVPEKKENDWADYLRGATYKLSQRYSLHTGMSGVIEGSLPIGGLSSSAAVIISFLKALCDVNNIALPASEYIEYTLLAENEYVGVAVGKLDPFCEVYAKKDHLLYLDTKDDSYELIPSNPDMKPYEIAIIYSGMERTLVGSMFNMRVDELKSAAFAIKAYSLGDGSGDSFDVPYGKHIDMRLRDVPNAVYRRYMDRLPDMWRRRAEHFYSENVRVEKGAGAWRRGDIDAYGKLIFESGYSSIYNYETGSDELKSIYEIMLRTDGIFGGRFSGAGFRGCCMALIDPAFKDRIVENITREYLAVFPQYKNTFLINFCQSSDGVNN